MIDPKWPALSRRGFFGLTGLSVGAAALSGLRARAGGEGPAPKRLLVIFTPDGTIHDRWRPTGSQTDFSLGEILAPLEAHRDDMIVLDGINRLTQGAGDGHEQGMTQILTGRQNLSGQVRSTGPSIDEFVNDAIGEGRNALRLGVVTTDEQSNWTRMTFGETGNPISVEASPYAAKEDFFAGFSPDDSGGGPTAEQARAERIRQALIGYSEAEVSALAGNASQLDRPDLQAHAEALRQLQAAPDFGEPAAACTVDRIDAWESGIDTQAHQNVPTLMRMHMELISAAFSCDRARVAVLQVHKSNSNISYAWADADGPHHALSHYESGFSDPYRTDALTKVYTWHAQQIAWLIGDLKATGVLDDTVVLWTSEMGAGASHTNQNIPMVLFGSGGGHFMTGRYMDYRGQGGVSHCDVLTSICNAMGIETDGYGEAASGPLNGIT